MACNGSGITIATNMRRPSTVEKPARHRARWFHVVLPGVAFALVPKCMLCGLAYVGLASFLGLTGPELCGGGITSAGQGSDWLTWGSVALGSMALLVLRQRLGTASRKIQRGHAA